MSSRIISVIALFIVWALATWATVDLEKPAIDSMKYVFISLGGYGVVSATLINIWNTWDASKNISDKIKFDITENSFKYFERWDSPSLKEARDLTRQIKKDINKWSDDELLKKIKECESTERSVITAFNFWEEIYKSITVNRVDPELLKESFGEVYCDMYVRFKVWREDKKKNNGSSNAMKALDELNKLWI